MRPVLICGCHRTGTSAVAGLVRELGLNFGEDKDLSSMGEERLDLWEFLPLSFINRRLLAESREWPGDVLAHIEGRLEKEARHLRDFHVIQAFKDPRSMLLLRFWLKIFPDMRILKTYRSHYDTAKSLEIHATGWKESQAYNLIDQYERVFWKDAHYFEIPVSVVSYPQLIEDPVGETYRIAEFLEIPGQVDASSIDPSLQHHSLKRQGAWWKTMNEGSLWEAPSGVTSDKR